MITALTEKSIECYEIPLLQESYRVSGSGDASRAAALEFIAGVASLYHDPEKGVIFGAATRIRERRSICIEDYTEADLALLESFLPHISTPELRARVGDILWIRLRKYQSAKIAVDAYLSCVESLIVAGITYRLRSRLSRLVAISFALGPRHAMRRKVIEYLLDVLQRFAVDDPRNVSGWVLEQLVQHKGVSAIQLAEFARGRAEREEANGAPFVALEFRDYECAVWRHGPHEGEFQRAEGSAAELCVRIAEGFWSQQSNQIAAVPWLNTAIQRFRRAGGMQARAAAVQQRLEELQQLAVKLLVPIAHEEDWGPELIATLADVEAMTFNAGIEQLAKVCLPFNKARLQKHAEERLNDPISSILGLTLLREGGRQNANIAPGSPNDPGFEQSLLQTLFHTASMLSEITGAYADLIRRVIVKAHAPGEQDLSWLVTGNAFVPPGRAEIYRRAIVAGFEGDYLVSTHLLVHQLENSLRFIWAQRQPSTFIDGDGNQDDLYCHVILSRREATEIWGEDLVVTLRAVLVERSGVNARNAVSHGQWPFEAFFSGQSVYLFGLTLWLLLQYRAPR